jgi:hypothetical protein
MLVLLRGVRGSLPHVPVASAAGTAGTKIAHPGYAE